VPKRAARKILDSGFFDKLFLGMLTNFTRVMKNVKKIKMGGLSHRNEMPQTPIFLCMGYGFYRGPFPSSFGFLYILLVVDYVSKWVKGKATRSNDSKVVVGFLKSNIFSRFGIPRAMINDQSTHFYNRIVEALMWKYEVHHQVVITYHP
jgi:hypothetical protein